MDTDECECFCCFAKIHPIYNGNKVKFWFSNRFVLIVRTLTFDALMVLVGMASVLSLLNSMFAHGTARICRQCSALVFSKIW